jgi:uncharacterized cupredoxin-like copper-binding protein
MKKLILTLVLGATASLALVACGSSSNSTTSSTPTTAASTPTTSSTSGGGGGAASSSVKLAASPSALAYDTNSLSAKAGNVTIDFNNPNSSLGHDVCVQDSGGKEVGCSDVITGSSTTLDLSNLKAGKYTFFCSVPGHEAAGMKGTLTVQ